MILKFATKQDINGNTYFLGIDYDKKTYSDVLGGFFHRSDVITITKKERRKMIDDVKAAGFMPVDCI